MEEKGQLLCELWLAEKLLKFRNDVRSVTSLFSTPYDVYDCDFTEENICRRISESCVAALKNKNLTEANRLLNYCEQHNIQRVRLGSRYYPKALADIPNPPYLLFCKGNVELLLSDALVSMVGTRSMTSAGKYSAFRMAYELAGAGMCVVSGMALGNDSMCHAGAVAAGGKTIAVLGCGIDVIYPSQHVTLYQYLVNQGHLVISEFLPGTRPFGSNFPQRNRIIAGLSFGTVVIEATEKSGALITADLAESYGRQVFAMPGYAYLESSKGNNRLTGQGAVIAVDSKCIIDEYQALTNKRLKLSRVPSVSLEICERAIDGLKIETRVTDPSSKLVNMEPERFFSPEKKISDFPFRVKQQSSGYSASAGGRSDENVESSGYSHKKMSGSVPKSKRPEKADNTAEVSECYTQNLTASDLCSSCEELGIAADDDIVKVCEVIASSEAVDTEYLHRCGCRTDVSLQILSILSSAGLLTEEAGGKFKLCKNTKKSSSEQ